MGKVCTRCGKKLNLRNHDWGEAECLACALETRDAAAKAKKEEHVAEVRSMDVSEVAHRPLLAAVGKFLSGILLVDLAFIAAWALDSGLKTADPLALNPQGAPWLKWGVLVVGLGVAGRTMFKKLDPLDRLRWRVFAIANCIGMGGMWLVASSFGLGKSPRVGALARLARESSSAGGAGILAPVTACVGGVVVALVILVFADRMCKYWLVADRGQPTAGHKPPQDGPNNGDTEG